MDTVRLIDDEGIEVTAVIDMCPIFEENDVGDDGVRGDLGVNLRGAVGGNKIEGEYSSSIMTSYDMGKK